MEASSVQLLGGWPSPFVNRVQMALKLKSIDHDFVEENYINKSERLLKANPVYKKIPVLIHDGKPICESQIIIQYVDHVWESNGPKILPLDPYDRAVARFWAAYIDDKWFPSVKELLQGADETTTRPAIIGNILEDMALLEDAFNKCSAGKDFFGGDNVGYVDLIFGSCLGWIGVIESLIGNKLIGETTTPALAKWADKFRSHDVSKGVVPQTEKLLEFYMEAKEATGKSSAA